MATAARPAADDPVALLQRLIACPSVTPDDAGALDVLAETLVELGFDVRRLTFSEPGTADVNNLFATIGDGTPHLAFSGHVDVVPPGDDGAWRRPPFAGDVVDGELIGRGAVDMKGGIACFVAAAARFLAEGAPAGRLSILLTADEEGDRINGTEKLVAWAHAQGHRFDAVLVGEPTSSARLGDAAKVGRRGSLSGRVTVAGRQGHVAYPHNADNPVPRLAAVLARLTSLRLDDGTADFEPSNLEVTGLETDSGASNVIPGLATADFNVRFNDAWTAERLKSRLEDEVSAATAGSVGVEIAWKGPVSRMFRTAPGRLFDDLSDAVFEVTGLRPARSTGGGTSDAQSFSDHGPVIEFGPVGTTMHRVDERVAVADLASLTEIYVRFLRRMLGSRA